VTPGGYPPRSSEAPADTRASSPTANPSSTSSARSHQGPGRCGPTSCGTASPTRCGNPPLPEWSAVAAITETGERLPVLGGDRGGPAGRIISGYVDRLFADPDPTKES
jgi:hypothetical protein